VSTTPAAPAANQTRAALALYLVVFFCGAILMGIEIAGAKILAPGFGTSTFVWGSIIGLFMGALATGYYVGGMFADKNPNFGWLAGIVSVSGVLTLLIPRFGPSFCESIARMDVGPVMGPLIASFAIFFLPSVLLGMVSPFAVKLNASSLSGLGSVAGKLYALSTFGSIVGTLATTFVLVPLFPLSTVMQGLGLSLLIVALVGFVLFKSSQGGLDGASRGNASVLAFFTILFTMVWAVLPVEPFIYPGQRLMRYSDSPYHEILITEDVIETDRRPDNSPLGSDAGYILPTRVWSQDNRYYEVRRWMKFNENIESGIYPFRDEHKNAVNYTDLLHLPVMWVNNPLPKKILIVGGGGGVLPTQYKNWYPGCQCDVAEIDEKVARLAIEYFRVPADQKKNVILDIRDSQRKPEEGDDIRFIIGDGRQIVRRMPDNHYDIIFLDAYSSGGQIPFHLMTWQFLNECKAKLNERGVLVTNIISGVKNVNADHKVKPAALFLAEYKTLISSRRDVTGVESDDATPLYKPEQLYVFPKVYQSRPMVGNALEEYRNVIVIATKDGQRKSTEELEHLIGTLTSGDKPVVRPPEMLWHVQKMIKNPSADELPTTPLSDNYAPVDTMYRPVKRDESSRSLYIAY